jgi:queuine/archaeosine tRNA-ribosyltransferase
MMEMVDVVCSTLSLVLVAAVAKPKKRDICTLRYHKHNIHTLHIFIRSIRDGINNGSIPLFEYGGRARKASSLPAK